MEVPATRQPGELALALDGETAPGAFLERVLEARAQLEPDQARVGSKRCFAASAGILVG